MKKYTLFIVASLFFTFTGLKWAYAQDAQEREMDESSVAIDKESHEPGDASRVEARLESKYHVTDARIDSLRHQGLGYGEIGITLSLAKQMPGGINDKNIQTIMNLRQGGEHKEGWGKIAHDLGLKIRPAVRDTDALRKGMEERNVDRHESVNGSANAQAHNSSISVHGGAGMGGGHFK